MQNELKLVITKEYKTNLLIIGGGVAGCAAAIAAGRKGIKVLLCEKEGCLGGSATMGLVSPLDAIATRDGISFGGLVEEISNELKEWNIKYAKADGNPIINPHLFQLLLLKKIDDLQIDLWFHVQLCSCDVTDNHIERAYFLSKGGIIAVEADLFIDATGDGDLLAYAGDTYTVGSESNISAQLAETGFNKMHFENHQLKSSLYKQSGAMQPASAMFTMGGVDEEKGKKYCNKLLTFNDLCISKDDFEKLSYAGTPGFEQNGDFIPMPQGRILFYPGTRNGEVVVNMSRVLQVDITDTKSFSEAEKISQLQVLYLIHFLKQFVPGFEKSYFLDCSLSLGIRESRRLKGKYVLTGTDVIHCNTTEHDVAYGSYMVDIHDPFGKKKAIGGELEGTCYGIPYGCLVSANISNLLVCGRCISVDHIAHASTRIQGTCIQTGQAAGTAAALCLLHKTLPSELDIVRLRNILAEDNMFQL